MSQKWKQQIKLNKKKSVEWEEAQWLYFICSKVLSLTHSLTLFYFQQYNAPEKKKHFSKKCSWFFVSFYEKSILLFSFKKMDPN